MDVDEAGVGKDGYGWTDEMGIAGCSMDEVCGETVRDGADVGVAIVGAGTVGGDSVVG